MKTENEPEKNRKPSGGEEFTDDPVLAAELDAIGRGEADGASQAAPDPRPENPDPSDPPEKPAENKKRRGIPPAVLTVVIVLLACVALYSGYRLYLILHAYQVGKSTYSGIVKSAVSTTAAASEKTTEAVSEGDTTETTAAGELNVDFAVLQKINPQIVAWIYSPDTVINYPVVQGTDNAYYLTHLSDGTYNASGSIFADYRNHLFQDTNTILFGHHMKDGSMFRSLVNYEKQSYYEQHPVMYLYTPDAKYELQLIAGAIIPGADSYYDAGVGYEGDISASLSEILNGSTFQSGVTYSEGDRLVTLSTCTYEYDDARYVVVGKLVQAG